MNQKGETNLILVISIFCILGVFVLTALELKKSYLDLEKRAHLFLCTKEISGELRDFITFMGKTNWVIKNTNRIGLISFLIPGLQGVGMSSQKIKKVLKTSQDLKLISYLKNLSKIKLKSCPIDRNLFITPFVLQGFSFKRNIEGAIILREPSWNYYFIQSPMGITLSVKAQGWEAPRPKINYQVSIKEAKWPSPFVLVSRLSALP